MSSPPCRSIPNSLLMVTLNSTGVTDEVIIMTLWQQVYDLYEDEGILNPPAYLQYGNWLDSALVGALEGRPPGRFVREPAELSLDEMREQFTAGVYPVNPDDSSLSAFHYLANASGHHFFGPDDPLSLNQVGRVFHDLGHLAHGEGFSPKEELAVALKDYQSGRVPLSHIAVYLTEVVATVAYLQVRGHFMPVQTMRVIPLTSWVDLLLGIALD